MVNRVVAGPLPGGGVGLRVSRPGYNALDAGIAPKGIAFDSRWTRAERVLLTGSVDLSAVFPIAYHTVSFGVTLSAPPTVLFMWRAADESAWRLPGTISGTWESSGGISYELMYVFNNRLEISRPTFGVNRIVSYIVLRP